MRCISSLSRRCWSVNRVPRSQNPKHFHQHQFCSQLLTCPHQQDWGEHNLGPHALDCCSQSSVVTFDTVQVSPGSIPSLGTWCICRKWGHGRRAGTAHCLPSPLLCEGGERLSYLLSCLPDCSSLIKNVFFNPNYSPRRGEEDNVVFSHVPFHLSFSVCVQSGLSKL